MNLRLITLILVIPLIGFSQLAPEKSYKVISDIIYTDGEGKPQGLDLYLPNKKSAKPLPVVVWVHGGGWMNGSKQKPRAEYLAEHGYAVASIDFRQSHDAMWPAQINDCRNAVRWLRSHAETYHLNPEKIGAWGSSSGGHLVALMGTLPYDPNEKVSSRVQAVCDWFGPTDLLSMPPNNVGNGRTEEDVANSNGAKLLGCTVKDCPDLAKQVSGLHNVSSDDAPFLIMHGDEDPGVPVSQSTRLHEELQAHGVYSELEIVVGAGHGGPQFVSAPVKQRVLKFFDSFLK
ncbi:MAG: alpha/beta hydrolase [Verrucomicrobia bacterium]|nr:alpha/beta hydrolase [Verrucomicrobiota bacterium]MDA1066081.1 alpha/beta hydrolase [Verrucomicrobiota bacterium]